MFIYADETGNSGKNIFDSQELYRQGALLTVADAEPLLRPIIRAALDERGLSRLHAQEMQPYEVGEVAGRIINALDAGTQWAFHVTTIHKPYLATTKFVDTVFDSGENQAVPPLWYNFELFRHVLCCVVDSILTPRNREGFWWAYLADDTEGIKASIRNAEKYLDRVTRDRRARQVVREAFRFALRYPEEFTLSASKPRRAYQGHTPNLVAFSSLLQAIHRFADAHGTRPIAFYHDTQQEFGTSMKEMHDLFGPLKIKETPRGAPGVRACRLRPRAVLDAILKTTPRPPGSGCPALGRPT